MDVYGHGDVTITFFVFTIKGETTTEESSTVNGDSIQLLESLDEMVSSFFADVFDTEVVDHKGEKYIFGRMLPKGRGSCDRGLAKLGKVDLDPIVCNMAELFQGWHAFADIQVHPSVGCELAEVVLGYDFFRNYIRADLHILIALYKSIVIYFLNIQSEETGTGGGDGAIQKALSRRQSGPVGCCVAR